MPFTLPHVKFRFMQRWNLTLTVALLVGILLTGCLSPSEEDAATVTIVADGKSQVIIIRDETTVSDMLRRAGITLNDQDGVDRVNPPGYSPISAGMTITVVRVVEETVLVEEDVPFESRTVPNDGLPAGEMHLVQAGVNGVAELTYRITYEDGVEVSRNEIRRVLITAPRSEIIMVGSQSELPTVTVNGTLAYISAGNAWIIRQNSANRRPLTLDGGVDGRVFELSGDGKRLLFTRSTLDTAAEGEDQQATATPETTPTGEEVFNSLWVILDTTDPDSQPIRLDLDNILDADWVPGMTLMIVYSTAEPRPSFPGWQANNDLWRAQISVNGAAVQRNQLLESSGGGIYGWYGTFFDFSPDGTLLAWARPDAVGVLRPYEPEPEEDEEPTATPTPDPEEETEPPLRLPRAYRSETLLTFAPRNAYDFVWVPGVAWSPDGSLIVTTTHGLPLGGEAVEDSPVFNLTAFPSSGGYSVDLVELSGMWASPEFSPDVAPDGSSLDVLIAYLQAIRPLDSVVSRYQLVVMDRDGSNKRAIFPEEDQPGLSLRDIGFAWSPDGRQIALTYQGNLYLVDVVTGLSQQLTGDGLSSSPRWKP